MILAAAIALLVGLGGGYLIGRDAGVRAGQAGAGGAGGTPSVAATAAPTGPQVQPTAEPTLSEEEMQQILEARRLVPTRDPEDRMAIGGVEAPVVMVEFADYRCSYCGRFTLETLPELVPLVNEGVLRIEFRDFPIFQEQSVDAAVAARAAARQDYFLEYHVAIYRYQFVEGGQDLSEATFLRLASDVGIPDVAQFQADFQDPALRAEVDAAYNESYEVLGRASTPQFVINDEYIGGAETTERFLEVILQELEKVAPEQGTGG